MGPERLPKYAAELGRLVRDVRSFARNAREQVRAEMGEEFDDVDWEALDPRRSDPRRTAPGGRPRGARGGEAAGPPSGERKPSGAPRADEVRTAGDTAERRPE